MARISVSKAWDETKAFITRERRLVSPVVLALVFLPTLLFRVFAPQPSMAEMMAGNYPAWLPWLSYGLLFVQLIGGAALILMALGSRDAVGSTIATGFKRAVMVVLATLLGALLLTPVLIVMLIIGGLAGGMPTNPAAIPPGFMAIVAVPTSRRWSWPRPMPMSTPSRVAPTTPPPSGAKASTFVFNV